MPALERLRGAWLGRFFACRSADLALRTAASLRLVRRRHIAGSAFTDEAWASGVLCLASQVTAVRFAWFTWLARAHGRGSGGGVAVGDGYVLVHRH
jgi:hypothetical protein